MELKEDRAITADSVGDDDLWKHGIAMLLLPLLDRGDMMDGLHELHCEEFQGREIPNRMIVAFNRMSKL